MKRICSVLAIMTLSLSPLQVFAFTDLAVPFTSQAPRGIWIEPWQNACEETVTIMVDGFYQEKTFTTESAEEVILELYTTKTKTYGWSLDEDADQIVDWINGFFPWEARVVLEPDVSDLQQQIDAGQPVIVPVYAPFLNNPQFSGYFAYHTVVLKGYDDEKRVFITNEPGTKFGKDYEYSYETIINAMHDFVPGGTRTGRKVAIFTSNKVTDKSAWTDADNDGLVKSDEIKYGTSLQSDDTDNDGYTDGQEVEAGFSPIINEVGSYDNLLVKSPSSPKVYIVNGNTKRHISNEQVFLANGWKWDEIVVVTSAYLIYLETGEPVI